MIKLVVLEMKSRLGMTLEQIGKLAGYETRQQATVSDVQGGNASPRIIEKLGIVVCAFVLLCRTEEDLHSILEMNGCTRSDSPPACGL